MRFGYYISFILVDKGVIETLGPTGLGATFNASSSYLTKFQSGFIVNYALFFFVAILCALTFTAAVVLGYNNTYIYEIFAYVLLGYGIVSANQSC